MPFRFSSRTGRAGERRHSSPRALKWGAGHSDAPSVRSVELNCPICQADLPLAGDERPGDEVHCDYCGAPCKIKGDPNTEPDDWEAEEDL